MYVVWSSSWPGSPCDGWHMLCFIFIGINGAREIKGFGIIVANTASKKKSSQRNNKIIIGIPLLFFTEF